MADGIFTPTISTTKLLKGLGWISNRELQKHYNPGGKSIHCHQFGNSIFDFLDPRVHTFSTWIQIVFSNNQSTMPVFRNCCGNLPWRRFHELQFVSLVAHFVNNSHRNSERKVADTNSLFFTPKVNYSQVTRMP